MPSYRNMNYHVAALALKAFSISTLTRRGYRWLGNSVGQRRRKSGGVASRIRKTDEIVAAIERFAPFQDDSHLFELGTGWMHWYALSVRLDHPTVRVSTFDVWDNRQFEALQARFRRLREHHESLPNPPPRVTEALDTIVSVSSLDELYEVFRMNYRIDAAGSLSFYPSDSMTHVISSDVLEHVAAGDAPGLVAELFRMLRPGGLSVHQIAIDDHLAHFDVSKSEKEYLRFSERQWRRWYQNQVQYFNRIQASDWLAMFEDAGFECLDVARLTTDISDLDLADQYEDRPRDDLECTRLKVVHRKPLDAI